MIGADDAAVFFNPRDFGTRCDFAPAGYAGATFPVVGIFSDAAAVALGDVATVAPTLVVSAAFPSAGLSPAAPRPPDEGDRLTIAGAPYRVAEMQPNGSGLIRLILERA